MDHPASSGAARGIWLALFAVVLWGANGTVVRWLAIRGVAPGVVAFLRVSSAGLVLAVGLRIVGGAAWGRHLRRLVSSPWMWAAVLGYGLNFLVFHAALGRVPAATVMILENTAPVVAMAGGWVFFRERGGARELAALALALAGAWLVGTSPGSDVGGASAEADPIGIALGLAAGVTWAAYILACRGLRSRGDDPRAEATASMALMLAGSALLLAPMAFRSGVAWPDDRIEWTVVLVLGLVSTAAATVTWRLALDYLSAFAASVLYLLTILVSMTVSGLWLGETVSAPKIGGACLVALAVVAVIRRRVPPSPAAP